MVSGHRLMGIVNVTPDSFSDGGMWLEHEAAIAHGLDLVRQGAEIVDVGGESTRPRSEPVAAAEELRRVLPVVEGLAAAAAAAAGAGRADADIAGAGGAGADVAGAGRADADMPGAGLARPTAGGGGREGGGEGVDAFSRRGKKRAHPPFTGEQPPFRISIDTSKAQVARAALAAGASLVNDVTALRGDPAMAAVVAEAGCDCCLMHMRGEPRTMQERLVGAGGPAYEDVVGEVKAFLQERLAFAVSQGIDQDRLLLDPGIGFGKTREHNFELLRRLDEIVAIGRPVLIGTSRKSFLGGARLEGTIATNVLALERGGSVFRVHDVAAVAAALRVAAATLTGTWTVSEATS